MQQAAPTEGSSADSPAQDELRRDISAVAGKIEAVERDIAQVGAQWGTLACTFVWLCNSTHGRVCAADSACARKSIPVGVPTSRDCPPLLPHSTLCPPCGHWQVGDEIKAVKATKEEGWQEELRALREEKKQLREKEKQLREKERQLREELLLLRR